MAPTSHDVARRAGVTQPTVSRALSGAKGVSEATRQRVVAAASALGYVPSEAGRSLRTRTARRIGIVAPELTNPFYPELIEPLRARLDANGFRAALITDHDENPVVVSSLADGSLDGVILTTSLVDSHLAADLLGRGIPVVLVNREIDRTDADRCVVDNVAGARQVADLLAGLGHTRIAAIMGRRSTSTGRDREAGFRRGLRSRGLPLPAAFVRRGPFTHEAGRAAMTDLLGLAEPPTAVFCGNDVVALGAYDAALELGLRIPDDLTLVGFDDIAMARWQAFRLTTVRVDLTALAETAVDLLLQRLRDPARPVERVVVPPELVLRNSHAVAQRRRR